MNILIDIDALEREGVVGSELAAKLRAHAVRDTGSTAINILLAFGAIAVAAGLVALTLSPAVTAVLGAGFIAAGYGVRQAKREMWGKLGGIWMIVGALTLSAYTTSAEGESQALDAAIEGRVALSLNLTGGVFVNQSAAFSDYHGTGGNPAANASLADAAFVANRFRVVQSRHHVPARSADATA